MPYFAVKRVDILLGEEEMAEIEQLEIGPEEFLGDFVVQRLMGVVAFFQEPADRDGDLFGVGFCLGSACQPARGRTGLRRGREEREVGFILEKEV